MPVPRLLLPTCMLVALASIAAASPLLTYREQTGHTEAIMKWQLQQQGERLTITSRKAATLYTNICMADGSTLQWQVHREPDTEIDARRVGNTIVLSGTREGEPIDRVVDIDGRPWLQPLSFSLPRFLSHRGQGQSFWTVRPDTLEILTLQARTQQIDYLDINGRRMPARKVEIRKTGLLSAVWSGHYWFRTSDDRFLQYRGTHGLPGTAETVISLEM